MKKVLAAAALGICAIAWTAPNARADGSHRFVEMTNHSKATIFHIQAGTPRRDDWGDDLLASDVVLPGETVAVAMDVADDRCSIDMKMVIDDGTAIVTRDIDICKTAQYEFTDDTIVAGEAGATTAS